MRTRYILISLGAIILALALTLPTLAAPPVLNWGSQVNAGQCDHSGRPVINVVQRIVNDVDSGLGGYWAFDHYTRQIQVWAQPDGSYCALARYRGHFDGQAGQPSPGNTGTLTGAEDGTFQGGYRAIITGALKSNPAWPTRGQIGTFDYGCDINANCTGRVNWVDQYFEPGWSFTFEWWGWVYHGGRYGTWVNSSDGNQGDILAS